MSVSVVKCMFVCLRTLAYVILGFLKNTMKRKKTKVPFGRNGNVYTIYTCKHTTRVFY